MLAMKRFAQEIALVTVPASATTVLALATPVGKLLIARFKCCLARTIALATVFVTLVLASALASTQTLVLTAATLFAQVILWKKNALVTVLATSRPVLARATPRGPVLLVLIATSIAM